MFKIYTTMQYFVKIGHTVDQIFTISMGLAG